MDNNALFAVLLLALGLSLVVAEIFIPSGGIIGILATCVLVMSGICGWNAWWESDRIYWWSYVGTVGIAIPSTIGLAIYILPKTSFGKNIMAVPPNPEDVVPYVDEEAHLRSLVGTVCRTASRLSPAGMVTVNNERLHCQSEGMMVEPDVLVRIIDVKGNGLVVRVVDEAEAASPGPLEYGQGDAPSAFDFDSLN